MTQRSKLGLQILLSMSLVSVLATLGLFVGSYITYDMLFALWPQPPPGSDWLPRSTDFLVVATFLLLGLIAAAVIALRLAKRILAPLNSLAESARRIAAGDLSARAEAGDRSLGETAHLVDDFNTMAMKLQNMAADMAAWNAAVAHELRTPLTILQGRLQGLKDGVFEPRDELLRNLLFQVEGLSRLVDDLRTVTLQDSGRLDVQLEPTNVGPEVQRAVDSMSPALTAAGISVELTRIDVLLECDAARLRQALFALLDNARRYAKPGRLQVHMQTTEARFILRVQDDGPGLSIEFARRAFEPFTRAEPSRLRKYGGSGLGLSVVRAIATAHTGEARYRSAPTGGSIFEIDLPLARSAPSDVARHQPHPLR
jgi:two-component system, OmpR family, sensor histidine kinase AdeS